MVREAAAMGGYAFLRVLNVSILMHNLDALGAYERKQKDDPTNPEYMLGRMRCLHALGEWERLFQLSKDIWKNNQDNTRLITAPLAAAAAWNLGEWPTMEEYPLIYFL